MNIGEFKNVNGRLLGSIATRSLDLPKVGLRPVESSNDKAPAYEVVALNVGGRYVQIGALWEATSNSTGEAFLQGTLDDPSLAEPLPVALFGSASDGFRVAWRRPQRRTDFGVAARGASRSEPRSNGGFGDSTAGADGALIGGHDDELDDQIPF